MKVLIDTNVVMDVLAGRSPFDVAASEVWDLVEKKKLDGHVSSITCTTIYYLARRIGGREYARAAVRKVAEVFSIAPVDAAIIKRALSSGMTDFEDAVQAFSGVDIGATLVVSRDAVGFAGGPLPSLTPEKFLAEIDAS